MTDYSFSPSRGKYYAKTDDGNLREVLGAVAESTTFQAVMANTGEMITGAVNTGLDAVERFGSTNYAMPESIMAAGRQQAQGMYNAVAPDQYQIMQNQSPAEMEAMSQLEAERPGASMAGDILPYAATAPLSGGLAAQTAIGALTGAALEGDAAGAGYGGLGGFGGGLAGRIIGKAYQALHGFGKAKPPMPAQAKAFEETGGTLLPSQRTGSEVSKNIEQSIRTGNVTGKLIEDVNVANASNTKRLVVNALDLGDDIELDQAGIALADKRLGTMFDDFGKGIDEVELSPRVLGEISAKAPGVRDLQIGKLDDALALGKEGIYRPVKVTGKQAMKIRSEINSELGLAKRASETERLVKLIKSFDDNFTSSAGIEGTAEYATLRNQYRLLNTMKKGNTLTTEGEVSTALLGNRLKNEYGSSYSEALAELSPAMGEFGKNIAASKSKLMQSGMGRSGTPEGMTSILDQLNPWKWLVNAAAKEYMKGGGSTVGTIEGLLKETPGVLTDVGGSAGAGTPQGIMDYLTGE